MRPELYTKPLIWIKSLKLKFVHPLVMDTDPYKAPTTAPSSPQAIGISGPYGAFRENGTLKTILVSLLVIDSMMSIFTSGVLNLLDIQQQKSDAYWLTEEPSQLDDIINVASIAHLLLIIVLMILLFVWINRSCKNSWLLDAPRMKTTPGWAVGYYFIPILMLWKPFTSMKEIRSASYGSDTALKAIIPLWWTFWLLSSFLNNNIFGSYLGSADQESYLMACKLDLVSVPIDVTFNYLTIALVTGITLAQRRRAEYWMR